MSTGQKIEFKNRYLKIVTERLSKLELDISKSSARRRFLRLISGFLVDIGLEQKELIKKYADKDEKGNPKIYNEEYVFSKNNQKKFNDDWEAVGDELVSFDVTPSNEQDIETIKGIMDSEIASLEKKSNGVFDASHFDTVELLREFRASLEVK